MTTMIKHNCRYCGERAPRAGALCDECRKRFIKQRESQERYANSEKDAGNE